MIDVSKLSPAPWTVRKEDSIDWRCRKPDGEEISCSTEEEAKFIVLARNAFDVMMRRRWTAFFDNFKKAWFPSAGAVRYFKADGFTDPFTALVEADRWYAANIEHAAAPV